MQRMTLAAGFLAGLMAGCGPSIEQAPLTNKVAGKVVYQDGKAYRGGGGIEFRSDIKEGTTSIGEIAPEGTFTLYTVTANHKRPGAQEGPHTVTIMPASPDRTTPPILLSKKYVIAAGDNQITVEIEE